MIVLVSQQTFHLMEFMGKAYGMLTGPSVVGIDGSIRRSNFVMSKRPFLLVIADAVASIVKPTRRRVFKVLQNMLECLYKPWTRSQRFGEKTTVYDFLFE